MAGFTTDYKKLRYRDFRTQGYGSNDDHNLVWGAAGSWTKNPNEDLVDYSMVSFLARLGYSSSPAASSISFAGASGLRSSPSRCTASFRKR